MDWSILLSQMLSRYNDRAIKNNYQNLIAGFVARSVMAEHAARMMAMKTATDNAGEMLGN